MSRFALATAAMLSLASVARPSTIYDPVAAFATSISGSANPNGVWSYQTAKSVAAGGSLNGQYSNLPLLVQQYVNAGFGNMTGWVLSPDSNYTKIVYGPGIVYTNAAGTSNGNSGSYLALNGGSTPETEYYWYSSILSWTAPSSGTVDINYSVFNSGLTSVAFDNTAAATPVGIALGIYNGTSYSPLYALTPLASGASQSLSYTGVSVNAGDQIQLYRDTFTNQQARIVMSGMITVVPEPAGVVLAGCGVVVAAAIRYQRRRR